MANIEVVIRMPEEDYDYIKKQVADGIFNPLKVHIANGITLPKGHGNLFDERDIVRGNYKIIGHRIYELDPILEADNNESIIKR